MERFIAIILESLKGPYFWIIVIISGLVYCGKSDFYKGNYRIPQWSYLYNENMEELTADIELQSGEIIMTPQIIVEYKGKIIFIINIEGLYNINSVSLDNHDGKSRYCIEISKKQNEKLKKFEEDFRSLIEEFLEEKYKNRINECTIYNSRLSEITFQNKNANQNRVRFYSISNDEIRMIKEDEKTLRGTEYSLNLDKLDENLSIYNNEEVMRIVEDCVQELEKIVD